MNLLSKLRMIVRLVNEMDLKDKKSMERRWQIKDIIYGMLELLQLNSAEFSNKRDLHKRKEKRN